MSYDVKALLASLAEGIARTETAEEAYSVVVNTANIEGIQLPHYFEATEKIKEMRMRSKGK